MRLVGVIAACATLALCAAPAAAGKGAKAKPLGPVVTVTTTGATPAPTDPVGTATATCPPGMKVLGGGFSAPFNETTGMVVYESHRSGPRSWTVSASRVNGPGAVTAQANCRRVKGRSIAIFTETETVGAGDLVNATGSCPRLDTMVGGGFTTSVGPDPDDLVVVQTNNPRNSIWELSGKNVGPTPLTLTAEAYCLRPETNPKFPRGIASGAASQSAAVTATSGACPKPKRKGRKKTRRTRLAAGGYILRSSGTGVLPFATESLRTPEGWQTSAVGATNATGTLTVTSRGVCRI